MPDDLIDRVRSLEEYQALFYKWIDELRSWTLELRASQLEHEERFRQNEERIRQNEDRISQNEETQRDVVEMQAYLLKLVDRMDSRLNGLETQPPK